MSDLVPLHYTTEFATNWIQRAQQTKTRLDAFVSDESFSGERKRYNRLASQSSILRTERKGATPISEASSDFRWAYRNSYHLANTLDREDSLNLGALVLPTSEYVQSHAMAHNRDKDDVAISAALGSVMTGELGTTVTAFATATQTVVHGGTGLTIAKLRSANQIFLEADLEDESGRVLVVTGEQITNLLATTEVTSADYNSVKALVNGQVDTFMGFKFIINQRLPKVSTTRTCVAWVKGAIKRYAGEKFSRINELPGNSYATQIYSAWNFGAVRLHDEAVVAIECTEAA